jgi:hypothetical protein
VEREREREREERRLPEFLCEMFIDYGGA